MITFDSYLFCDTIHLEKVFFTTLFLKVRFCLKTNSPPLGLLSSIIFFLMPHPDPVKLQWSYNHNFLRVLRQQLLWWAIAMDREIHPFKRSFSSSFIYYWSLFISFFDTWYFLALAATFDLWLVKVELANILNSLLCLFSFITCRGSEGAPWCVYHTL